MTQSTERDDEPDGIDDGRVRRGARNRGRIVDALIELVREGSLLPTAEQVAARAGVGTRTVFRHFDDMDGLFGSLSERLEIELMPTLDRPAARGPLDDRARAMIKRRIDVFERATPFMRSDRLLRWRSAFLQGRHRDMVAKLRSDLEQSLGPEIGPESGPAFDALELVTSFEAWDRLRADARLGRDRAQQVVETAVLALLKSAAGGRTR